MAVLSQYTAWVLLHGNSISHFAARIRMQGNSGWPDLEMASRALSDSGVPMKKTIGTEKGSVLRQTAVLPSVETFMLPGDEGDFDELAWPYAYFELIERGFVENGSGQELFTGFNADHEGTLFNMTQTREN